MPNDSAPATRTTLSAGALPLDFLQVLHLSDGVLPALGKMLADAGADVEVAGEPPTYDDTVRELIETRGKRYNGRSAGSEESRDYLLSRLGEVAVLIATPQDLQRYGLPTADEIGAAHPDLVVAVLTGFGLTGPRADWHGSEAVYKALSGSLSRSGEPGRPPLLQPGELFGRSAAAQLAWSIVAAYYRSADGRGGAVLDCSVFEAGAVCLDPANGMAGSGTPDIVGARNRPKASHLYPIYRTLDGFVRLVLLARGQWAAMLDWMGHPPELADEDLILTQVRQENPDRVLPHVQAFVANMTTDELVRQCRERRIPVSAVLGPADVLTEPHFLQSGVLREIGRVDGRPVVTAEGVACIDGVRAIGTVRPDGVAAAPAAADVHVGSGPYPLAGITVLDLGIIVAGPVAGELFAELGARVIRVENTGFPDGMRRSFDEATPSLARGHRGKESVGLDLRTDTGREILLQLAARADIVVSNFKPGTLTRLGISYADLSAVNPQVVLVESSGFGDSGPWKTAMGYGPLVRSGGGHSWLWRESGDSDYFADGITIFPDHLVGRVCALNALACVLRRRRHDVGAHVTVAQCDVGLWQLDELLAAESLTPGAAQPPGVLPGRWLLSQILLPARGEDDWCVVDPQDDAQLRALEQLVGAAGDGLEEAVAAWVADRDAIAASAELQQAGIAAGHMLRVPEMVDDPALIARELYGTTTVAGVGDVLPVERFSVPRQSLPSPHLEPFPMFGTHTRAVLRELGRTDDEIDRLFEANVAQASEVLVRGGAQ